MYRGNFLKASAAAAIAAAAIGVSGMGGVAHAADVAQPVAAGHTWDLLFGATATSDYITRGHRQTVGPAFQPWAELDVGPVYFGYWGSNVDPGLVGGAHFENDLSIGVRGTHGPIGWDVGYVRYVYDVSSVDFGEAYVKGTINPVMPLTLGVNAFYSPDLSTSYVEGNATYSFAHGFKASAAVGVTNTGENSWNAGLSYTPASASWLTLDGRYYAGVDADKFVVSVAFSTSLKTLHGG
jgi:uncharacterized protein (TIGR02001 family)